MERHILNMLKRYADGSFARYHMPGHKGIGEGELGGIYQYDVTELSFSDNLMHPTGVILQAERDLAHITGAERSRILTGGSTLGVLTSIYAAKRFFKGKAAKLAICKSSHKSVYNALKLLNIEPVFLPEKIVNGLHVLQTDGIAELFDNELIGALITTPDYFGRVTDLKEVREILPKNALLLVDGAHGAHLSVTSGSKGEKYADLCVESAHKTLKTLTQGALLNVYNKDLIDFVDEGLSIFGTSSPSYPIMASVEDGYKTLAEKGEGVFDGVRASVKRFKDLLCEDFSVIKNDDVLKLCIDLNGHADGETVGRSLEGKGIFAELACGRFIIFMLSDGFGLSDAARLADVLNHAERGNAHYDMTDDIPLLTRATAYLTAANADSEVVDLNDAVGRISASDAGLFPPCYPLITCGEVLDKRVIDRLSVDNTFGLNGKRIKVVKE